MLRFEVDGGHTTPPQLGDTPLAPVQVGDGAQLATTFCGAEPGAAARGAQVRAARKRSGRSRGHSRSECTIEPFL